MPQQFCKPAIINKQEYWTGFSGKTLLVNVDLVRKCFCISIIHSNTQVTKNCIRSLRKVKKNEIPLASRNQSVRIKPIDEEWRGFWEQFQPRPRGMRRWGRLLVTGFPIIYLGNQTQLLSLASCVWQWPSHLPDSMTISPVSTEEVNGAQRIEVACPRSLGEQKPARSGIEHKQGHLPQTHPLNPRAALPEQGSPVLVLKWMPRGFWSSMGEWEKCIKEVNFS